jgi:hypothetical protein
VLERRGRRSPRFALGALLGVLLTADPATAYVRGRSEAGTPTRWRSPNVTLALSDAPLPHGLRVEQVREALEHAAAACVAARTG